MMADFRFENNILGFVTRDTWLGVGFSVERPGDPIDGLFGDERTDNLVARWQSIAHEYQVPMMAQFHAFDAEANTTFRVPVDTHNIEKGLIKVKLNQSERMRELKRSGVVGDQALYEYVINDGVRLAEQVVTRSKVAKNELMATGKVTIKENRLDQTVDYGVGEDQLAFTLDLSAAADVPASLQGIIDAAMSKGVTITGMMTGRKNLTRMRSNEAIQKAINGNMGVGALVRSAALNDYLETEYGIRTVVVNDQVYGADAVIGENGRPSITQKRYFPEDKITFFATNPSGRLGVGLWGDPLEVDVRPHLDGGASGVSPYVYISQWAEDDPTVLWTKASALFMPVLYNPSSLWIATVTAGE